ncbi:MAG: lactoylglutathione lyase [Rhodospirillaceae bacterium]|jgi:lactoylglutathione lyase|nr:lactoylglutathione lyase [Rhodospirillaceae bacterium]MBT5564407.1 lactoylglutathione lyase [Rhodospirillaceae bacterium]MBT6088991.1 lactoylglutathione lyase [Rhodospirillaceae bacterium]
MKYLHTAVRVTDLVQALDFYCGQMGMIEVRRFKGHQRPCDIIFLAMPGDDQAQIEVVYYHDAADREKYGNFSHVAYQVENIYDTCQELMDKGLSLNLPPRDGFMAFVKSPDGISFELLQKGGPLPPEEPWASMPDQGTW